MSAEALRAQARVPVHHRLADMTRSFARGNGSLGNGGTRRPS